MNRILATISETLEQGCNTIKENDMDELFTEDETNLLLLLSVCANQFGTVVGSDDYRAQFTELQRVITTQAMERAPQRVAPSVIRRREPPPANFSNFTNEQLAPWVAFTIENENMILNRRNVEEIVRSMVGKCSTERGNRIRKLIPEKRQHEQS